MRIRTHIQTEQVADGRRRTSAQAQSASAAPLQRLLPSHEARPHSPACATRRIGAPHEGLLVAPHTARSQKHEGFQANPSNEGREL
jgi:hypothetical protein